MLCVLIVGKSLTQKIERKPKLKLGFCSFEAVKYACTKWHYSKSVPTGKLVKIGIWEDDKFVGCIVYGRGTNFNIGSPFCLGQDKVCELVRIACRKHHYPVTKYIAVSFKLLKQVHSGLELVVSYADSSRGHHGGIYQGSNWIYTGASKTTGWKMGDKIAANRGMKESWKDKAEKLTIYKHKYIMPFKNKDKYKRLSKKYPKHVEHESNALNNQLRERGAVPTSMHQGNRGNSNV